MLSNRRLKASFLIVTIVVLLTLYISASARQTRSSDFYTKTQNAIVASKQAKEAKLAGEEVATGEDDLVKNRVKAAAEVAKIKADSYDRFNCSTNIENMTMTSKPLLPVYAQADLVKLLKCFENSQPSLVQVKNIAKNLKFAN